MITSLLTLLIGVSTTLTIPAQPQITLNLADQYTRGQTIAISVTNHESHAITIDEAGQCHRFFKVLDSNHQTLTITNPALMCTMEFRSVTLAPNETKVIDQWDQNIHTYCPDNAQCFAPPTLPAASGAYTIQVEVSGPTPFTLEKTIIIGSTTTFSDVPTSHWAYTYITDLFTKNIINGYGNGKFGPENSITRGELVKIAINAALKKDLYPNRVPGCWPTNCVTPEIPTPIFEDVHIGDTFYPYISLASQLNIIETGRYFRPNEKASRFDCLQILLNAFQKRGEVMNATPSASSFNDVSSPAMTPYTNYGASEGIVSGVNNKFYPNEFVRRGEIAKMAYNLMNQK